jgi:WXG100 family type VII secretion target
MSNEIKASPAQLEASAANIEQQMFAIRKEIDMMNDTLMTLRRTFIGQRATGFFKQYDANIEDTSALTATLRALTDELRQTAARLRAADQA